MTSSLKSTLRNQTAVFLFWTALGLFMSSQGVMQKIVQKDPFPWWHYLTSFMVGVYVWFLVTPLVLWFGRRLPFERRYWMRRTAAHLALSLAVSLGQLSIESLVLHWIGVFPPIMGSFSATLAFLLIIGFHQSLMTYWGILAVQYGFGWYRRYQERKQEALRLDLHASQLRSQLVQAHLSTLKMQIQPHFLFNTLNAIMVLVRQQKGREAEEMLSHLSDLLRSVLDDANAQEVPLRRELEYVQLYLAIEQVRFQDRLQVAVEFDPEVLDAAVPHMVLQPLVENAIRHGIGRSLAAGKIRISAARIGDRLEMKVQDDGPGLEPTRSSKSGGIGLANTRARLSQLYGQSAHLSVENCASGGVVATVVLPCRAISSVPVNDLMETHAVHGLAG